MSRLSCPFFVRSGVAFYYGYGSNGFVYTPTNGMGRNGHYWSSYADAATSDSVGNLYFDNSRLYSSDSSYYGRDYGFSLRCLAS